MSDMADDFKALQEINREQRMATEPKRVEYAIKKLQEIGFNVGETQFCYIQKDDQLLVIKTHVGQIDFWPYSGWFCGRQPLGKIKGRGIKNLIDALVKLKEWKKVVRTGSIDVSGMKG